MKPATHGIDEHVSRLKMRGGIGVALLPALKSCERVVFALCASDFYERAAGLPAPRRLHPRGLSSLFSIVWRPRRIPQAVALLLRRELEQRFERAGVTINASMYIAESGEARWHRRQREVAGLG